MAAEKPLSWHRCLHNGADLTGKPARRGLLLEFEIYISQPFLLLKNPFLRRCLSEQGDVLEENLHDFLVVFQAVFRQSNLAIEYSRGTGTDGICSCE